MVQERGVEKAPVDWAWSFSKSSCSSLGRRGGEGPGRKREEGEGVVVRRRRRNEKRRCCMNGGRIAG